MVLTIIYYIIYRFPYTHFPGSRNPAQRRSPGDRQGR